VNLIFTLTYGNRARNKRRSRRRKKRSEKRKRERRGVQPSLVQYDQTQQALSIFFVNEENRHGHSQGKLKLYTTRVWAELLFFFFFKRHSGRF